MNSPAKKMTRRDLLKEMVSKDTLKQVMGAWYGFSKPFSDAKGVSKKKDSLLTKVKAIDMKYMTNNGKEG
jgi:hypothetical protein